MQTGTVAMILRNIALYNINERGKVKQALQAAVPTLWGIGMFDLFPPAEWVAGDNLGRRLVGKAAQTYAISVPTAG